MTRKESLYLLGSEDNGLPPRILERAHYIVRAPGVRCLNVSHAGAVVLYDRIAKQQEMAA